MKSLTGSSRIRTCRDIYCDDFLGIKGNGEIHNMNMVELKNLLAFEYDRFTVTCASILIIIISAIFTALMGLKALIVLAGLGLIVALFKSGMNLLWLFLFFYPIIISISVSAANVIGYFIALTFIVAWFVKSILEGFENLRISKELAWLMTTFLFISLISVLPGGLTKSESYTMIRLGILFTFIVAFYDSFSPKDTMKYFFALSIPLLLNGFEILRIFFSANTIIDFFTLIRMKVGGFFQNANAAGYMFLLGAPFWIAVMLWHERRIIKAWSAVASLIMLLGLILTSARASIVGIFVSIFFFALWKRKLKYYFGTILLALVIIFSSSTIQDIFSLIARVDRGLTSRDIIWLNTVDIIKDNPIFGIGIGNYARSYEPYFVLAWEKGFMESMPNAHNLILSKTAELGISGLVWILFLYFLPIKTGFDLSKKAKTNRDKAIIYGILATILGLYTQSLFEAGGMLGGARFTPDVFFWILFATLLKAKALYDPKKAEIF